MAHKCEAFSAEFDYVAMQHDQISDFLLPKIQDSAQAQSRFGRRRAATQDNSDIFHMEQYNCLFVPFFLPMLRVPAILMH
jgi:hypothetical protein